MQTKSDDKTTMVAIRTPTGRRDVYRFPTQADAEAFVADVRRNCPSVATAIEIRR